MNVVLEWLFEFLMASKTFFIAYIMFALRGASYPLTGVEWFLRGSPCLARPDRDYGSGIEKIVASSEAQEESAKQTE